MIKEQIKNSTARDVDEDVKLKQNNVPVRSAPLVIILTT